MLLYILTFFLCLLGELAFSHEQFPRHIVFSCHAHAQDIVQQCTFDLPIVSLSYDSDVQLSCAEFEYLMDMRPGVPITNKALQKGIGYLFQKKKYESIALTVEKKENGLHIHCIITGLWTFKKLILRGMLINKEYYRRYYSMESGDVFDHAKHSNAVEKIKEAFAQEGYFDARVQDSFQYDYATKQVCVTIALKRNNRFKIGNVRLTVQSNGPAHETHGQEVRALCDRYFVKHIAHRAYSKIAITRETSALQKLLAQKGYNAVDIQLNEHIDTQKSKVDLSFTLIVHQKKEVLFKGNIFFSQEHLLDTVLQFGKSASLLPASIIAEEITAMYHTKGFLNVRVMFHEEAEQCIITIDEGQRASVERVVIKNTNAMILTDQESWVSDFLAQDFYDEHIFQESINALCESYRQKGYWDVAVAKQEFVTLDTQSNTYQLNIVLEEGMCSYITELVFEIDKESTLDKHALSKKFQESSLHIPFTFDQVEKQRRLLIDYFKKQGYRFVEVKPEIKKQSSSITLIWKIVLGASTNIFGKTIIVGDTKIPFEYIKRELCYKEGAPWDNDVIKDTFLRLKSWHVFDSIHITPEAVPQEKNEKAIIVKVQEDDPYELRLRAGIELQQVAQFYIPEGLTYKLGGSFILKSPFHRGDVFRIDADFARVYRELAVKYEIPWLFNQPIKSLFTVYSNKYLQPAFVGGEKSIYDSIGQGFLAGLNRKFEFIDIGLNLGFEWLKTSIPDRSSAMLAYIDSIAKAINFDQRLLNRSVPFFQVEPTIMIDCVDRTISPHKGAFTLVSCKGMVPVTTSEFDAYFVKGLVEQSFFFPIKKKVVIASRFRAGHIFLNNLKNVMPMERFYLGGANSLRSYDTDFAPPLGFFLDQKGRKQYVPQGSQSMLNVNFELRFPLYKKLGAVLFQDIGALSNTKFADFKAKDILLGTGFGLRVSTPVGPLRFDIGWKWAHEPAARSFAWFFTFGQAF